LLREQGADAPRSPEEAPPVRWEFYVGGMFGLLLGFVLRANGLSSQAILGETWAALLRSVVWFAAFGLLERVAWSDRGRVLALVTGIAAVLLNLCVSSGIDYPSVAGPLWVAIALALNAAALRPVAWLSRPGAAMILPLPILFGVVLGYAVYILYPVLAAHGLTREADESIAYFQTELAKPPKERAEVINNRTKRINFIRKGVLERLEEAKRLTPDDARLHVQLAWWYGLLWQHLEWQTARSDLPIAEKAIVHGDQATRLDPEGGQGYWVQYVLRTRLFAVLNEEVAAKGPNRDPIFVAERELAARRQYELAAQKLEEYLPYDPTDAALRFQLARAWFKAGDKEKGREQAEAASRLDEAAVLPTRKLADPQREQVQKWLSASPSG
jgi:tetratricopeptide (TPR) repeat protein